MSSISLVLQSWFEGESYLNTDVTKDGFSLDGHEIKAQLLFGLMAL